MERFLKVALELLKQFFIAIMKLESSFIKFLLNQATIWRNKFPEFVTGQNDLLGYLGAASGQRYGGSIYPKKIVVFMWRACKNIFPTHVNSIKWRVISVDTCEACKQFLRQVFIFFGNAMLHRMDVWAGCSVWLQKCVQGLEDMIHLMGELLDRLAVDEFELFLVQAWLFGIKDMWWFMVGSSKSPVLWITVLGMS